ncbi:SGNH/GDSL hydrolase family protein [Marivita sp.]|uniref:SGNH/GDSL hydrolase family protein n=1 Tax=Marivita sp. TaxID=2003365 RepID=UPI003F6B4153
MAVILCYGDSNTHGAKPLTQLGAFDRHAPGDRWPDAMAKVIGQQHTVLSEGLPGRTTVHDDLVEGGMRNGLTVLPAILHSHTPIDLMILMLGTNDLKHRFSVTAFEITRSLERLVQVTRAEGVVKDILLVAPVPVLETGVLRDVFAGAQTRQQGLSEHIAVAADRQACGFFDAGLVAQVSTLDGVHWDAANHQAVGAAMAQTVSARL